MNIYSLIAEKSELAIVPSSPSLAIGAAQTGARPAAIMRMVETRILRQVGMNEKAKG